MADVFQANRGDAAASNTELWPFEEARRIAERVAGYAPSRPVIFESGFGPSGLPHLGTMAEVLRPAFVRKALAQLEPARASRLIVFIDDMDGLRKVPENVPNREATARHLGEPVSKIPDPFGCCVSFADHMIGLLGGFLAPVEADYELMRSSEMYASGKFDDGLKRILEKHAEIIAIITPTLREENRAGWSPFMPICPKCRQINSTLVTAYHPERATVEFSCERHFGNAHPCGHRAEQSILGGMAKVQWKVDWALRWYVLQVDYELYGKDLIDSARLSGEILKVLGGNPPLGFPFEMFLDEEGRKVSKSVGRGVTVDQWTRYAPIEVLKYFLLLNPRRARKLFLEAIPQYVDEYLDALREYSTMAKADRQAAPLEFVLQTNSARRFDSELSFGMIMNLVAALGTSDGELIWNYLVVYDTRAISIQPPGGQENWERTAPIKDDQETARMGRALIECALNFYRDFIEPTKKPYDFTDAEREQLEALRKFLLDKPGATDEEIERAIYEIGRANYDKPGKIFPLIYRAILCQERGPRVGKFIRVANATPISVSSQTPPPSGGKAGGAGTTPRIVELLDAAIARGSG
ncbi:MAG TPA: lysine--tRNA ligase [Candidatus Binataceae bacterium]|nr:lysine--tRNA ligase [Candidatus Binataceae bacterium]